MHDKPLLAPEIRTWIYSLLTPISLLAMFYGITSEEEAGLWIGLIGQALTGGTAVAYRPTRSALPADPAAPVEPPDRGDMDASTALFVTAIAIAVVAVASALGWI